MQNSFDGGASYKNLMAYLFPHLDTEKLKADGNEEARRMIEEALENKHRNNKQCL